jgi:hypothetical protein
MTPTPSLEISGTIYAETKHQIQDERITYLDQSFTFLLEMPANFLTISIINSVGNFSCGRNSVDGMATRCGMDGPGIQIRWRDIFCVVQTNAKDHQQ